VRKVGAEFVCFKCGIVQNVQSTVCTLPFGETYQPTNFLTFGKSLGDTLRPQDMLKVLSNAHHNNKKTITGTRLKAHEMLRQVDGLSNPNEVHKILDTILDQVIETHLGLQARSMRIASPLESQSDHEILEYASQKLILLGFGKDHIVSNEVGALIRKLTAWLRYQKIPYHITSLADAIIYYVLTEYHRMQADPPPKRNNGTIETNTLKFREKELRLIEWFDQQWRTIKIFCDGTRELLS
jgi:hypothetical protein